MDRRLSFRTLNRRLRAIVGHGVVSTGAQRRDRLGFSTRRLRHLQFQPHPGRHPRQSRAFVSAGVTAALLASASIAVFGTGVWAAFPRQLFVQTRITLFVDPDIHWGLLQTVYGLVRYLNGSAELAWLARAVTTIGLAIIAWMVWRSGGRNPL